MKKPIKILLSVKQLLLKVVCVLRRHPLTLVEWEGGYFSPTYQKEIKQLLWYNTCSCRKCREQL